MVPVKPVDMGMAHGSLSHTEAGPRLLSFPLAFATSLSPSLEAPKGTAHGQKEAVREQARWFSG